MNQPENRIIQTFDLIFIALMVAFTVVSAQLKLVLGPIPITLQTFIIIFSGILLGPRKGWLVPSIYLVMGLAGLPFFAGGGGIAYLFMPSFGFLLGFIPGALVAGLIYQMKPFRRSKRADHYNVLISAIPGMAIIYLLGFLYIPVATQFLGSKLAVWAMLLPTLPFVIIGDCLKMLFLAAILPIVKKESDHIRQSLSQYQA